MKYPYSVWAKDLEGWIEKFFIFVCRVSCQILGKTLFAKCQQENTQQTNCCRVYVQTLGEALTMLMAVGCRCTCWARARSCRELSCGHSAKPSLPSVQFPALGKSCFGQVFFFILLCVFLATLGKFAVCRVPRECTRQTSWHSANMGCGWDWAHKICSRTKIAISIIQRYESEPEPYS